MGGRLTVEAEMIIGLRMALSVTQIWVVVVGMRRFSRDALIDVVTFIAIIVAMVLVARGFGVGWAIGAAAFLTRLTFRVLRVRNRNRS